MTDWDQLLGGSTRRERRRIARLERRMGKLDGVPRERRRSAAAVVAVVLMLVGAWFVLERDPTGGGTRMQWPPAAPDVAASPPSGPPDVDPDAGTHAFIAKQDDGSPVTYDRCAPIHVVVATPSELEGADVLLDQAIDEVSRATGLQFVIDGPTNEQPTERREVLDTAYGDGWAPVLVAWTDPDAAPELEGDIAGFAGSVSYTLEERDWFVSGTVTLDVPQLQDIIDEPGGWAAARSVVMHELGHLVGLDHVDDPAELMQPEGSVDVTTWGPGDRAGLAELGSGPCLER